ncbi:MAG: hypothetical protein HY833_02780 [Candidatus Aenigmarchaeota archaeon]|nr:hypothetical protein [Candidatus Aenigmarchaeota archaeon]
MGIEFLGGGLKKLFGYDVASPNKIGEFIEKSRRDGKTRIDVVVREGESYLYKDVGVYKIGIYLDSHDKKGFSLGEITKSVAESAMIKSNVMKKAGYIRKEMENMGFESDVLTARYKNM